MSETQGTSVEEFKSQVYLQMLAEQQVNHAREVADLRVAHEVERQQLLRQLEQAHQESASDTAESTTQ